jgi:ADP-heptose:LPS heptosyltransferase
MNSGPVKNAGHRTPAVAIGVLQIYLPPAIRAIELVPLRNPMNRNDGAERTAAASMSMSRMKAIDHWVGLPLCVSLGMARKLLRALFPREQAEPNSPRRILVMKFFGLGSVVLAGPMLRAIRQRYPRSTLTFLTFDGVAGLVERMGVCDEVRRLRTTSMLSFGADVVRQLLHFAAARVDVCIDLEFFSKFSTLISVLSGARVRVAFHLNSFWRGSLATHPVYYNYYRHVGEAYNDAAKAIDAPVSDTRPCRLACARADRDRCRDKLRAGGWNGSDRLIGINVNAGELALERRWPPDRFAQVLERLCARPGVQPVLTGAPSESAYVAGVCGLVPVAAQPRVLNMAGRFSFDEFVASMDLFEFFLTNDSGPLHVAAAQGVDTISLWGVGRPSFYGPLVGNHSTFYRNLPCSPCLYMFTSEVGQWCAHRADCMQAIDVEEVWAAVQTYLDTPKDARHTVTVRQGR